MDNDKTQNFFNSKTFKIIFLGLAGFIAILFVFKIGMIVGFKKADFSRNWTENYHLNFGGPRGGFFHDFDDDDFIGAHGIAGQVIKTDGSSFIVKGWDNFEKILNASDNVVIRRFRDAINIADVKTDDFIVAIGEPDANGQIEAKFIRVMPSLPAGTLFNKKFPFELDQ